MKLTQVQENVDELAARRAQKQNREQNNNNAAAAKAIQDMKDDIVVSINSSIDALMASGMDEDFAMDVVMTHLSDLVMGKDLDES